MKKHGFCKNSIFFEKKYFQKYFLKKNICWKKIFLYFFKLEFLLNFFWNTDFLKKLFFQVFMKEMFFFWTGCFLVHKMSQTRFKNNFFDAFGIFFEKKLYFFRKKYFFELFLNKNGKGFCKKNMCWEEFFLEHVFWRKFLLEAKYFYESLLNRNFCWIFFWKMIFSKNIC